MSETQTQIHASLIPQPLLASNIDMMASSSKKVSRDRSRSSRRRDRERERYSHSRSRMNRSRDREREHKKEKRHRDRDRDRKRERSRAERHRHRDREHHKDRERERSGLSSRKRRRSPNSSAHHRTNGDEEHASKRRKLHSNNNSSSSSTIAPPSVPNNMTFDMNSKIKNLVANSKINIHPSIEIPAVLQDTNPQSHANTKPNGNVAVENVAKNRNPQTNTSRSDRSSSSESKSKRAAKAAANNNNNEAESSGSEESDSDSDNDDDDSSSYTSDSECSSDSDSSSGEGDGDGDGEEEQKEKAKQKLKEKDDEKEKQKEREKKRRSKERSREREKSASSLKRRDRAPHERMADGSHHSGSHLHVHGFAPPAHAADRDHRRMAPVRMGMVDRRRLRTPDWLSHQTKQWFKAMEMITKFNHRVTYQQKFLDVFEQSVYEAFPKFWHGQDPTVQDITTLEKMFEKTYFERFQSIRQVREYQEKMQFTTAAAAVANVSHTLPHVGNNNTSHNNNVAAAAAAVTNLSSTANAAASSYATLNLAHNNDLLSMLNLGDDLNQNIQNLQAALMAVTQPQQQQPPPQAAGNGLDMSRTVRVPRLLQDDHQLSTANSYLNLISQPSTNHTTALPTVKAPPPQAPPPMQPQPPIEPQYSSVTVTPSQTTTTTTIAMTAIAMPTTTTTESSAPAPVAAPVIEQKPSPEQQPQQPTMVELPTPEPLLLDAEMAVQPQTHTAQPPTASKSISPTVEMPPSPNDSDDQAPDQEQQPSLPLATATSDMEQNINDDQDDNMSVRSDVVTEDDYMMLTGNCNGEMNPDKGEDSSTNSMSPEVAIEAKNIVESGHAATTADDVRDKEDIDFEATLNVLGEALFQQQQQEAAAAEAAMDVDMNMNVHDSDAAENGVDASFLFADDDVMNTQHLPGLSMPMHMPQPPNPNTNPNITAVTDSDSKTASADDRDPAAEPPCLPQPQQPQHQTVPAHYIPPPTYFNPPEPGQDIDRRQLRKMNILDQAQPHRRAVRRRPKNNNNHNNNVNNLNMNGEHGLAASTTISTAVPKSSSVSSSSKETSLSPESAGKIVAKKRGFFNRLKTPDAADEPPAAMDKSKMIKSRMHPTRSKKPLVRPEKQKTTPPSSVFTALHRDPVRKPMLASPRKLSKKSFANRLIPKVLDASNTAKPRVPRTRPTPQRLKRIAPIATAITTTNNHNKLVAKRNKTRHQYNTTTSLVSLETVKPKKRSVNATSKAKTAALLAKKSTRPMFKRPDPNLMMQTTARTMPPSRERHFMDLGPRLEAPPTDLNQLFDEKPSSISKKKETSSAPAMKKSNTQPQSRTATAPANGRYYNPHAHAYYPPNYFPPPQAHHYPPPHASAAGHPGYYPPPHAHAHAHAHYNPAAAAAGPPPPGHPAYYRPPPHAAGAAAAPYYPPPPQPNTTSNASVASSSSSSAPDVRKYKRIAKYRDLVFFPDGHKKLKRSKHKEHIDNQIHERTKLLLFLDIDHTILHSTRDPRGAHYMKHPLFGKDIFAINFPNQYNATYYIKFRPEFRRMIQELTPLYDLVLYTMGSRAYAEQVAMVIDEHFRQFASEFQAAKAHGQYNRTFIIGNRIICREDHGHISDKEYKKDVSQFAPIDTDWCMIIDDTPEVWINRDQVHRVPKYLFWPNPDKTAPGTNHKHLNGAGNGGGGGDTNNNKINIWSKNSITTWGDDKSLLRQERDNVLLQCIELSKTVHECYYAQYTPMNTTVSTAAIFAKIRRQIMRNVQLVFTGVFPQKNAKNDFHWKLAELFGATVSGNITDATTHLIGKDSKTSKMQQAIKQDIEIVHINWLYQSVFNFATADCHRFRMFINGDEKHTPPMHCFLKPKSKRDLVSMYQT